MRLLITTDSAGGVWDYTATLTTELERLGHAVLLAVVGHPTTEQLGQLPEGIAVECRPYRLEWMPEAAAHLPKTAEWIGRLGRAWGAAVVHLNQMAYTGITTFTAPTVVVVHSDVCSWFTEVTGAPPGVEWEPYRGWVEEGLRRASRVIAPTRYQADLTARHYGRTVNRVIHNASADPPGERPPKERLLLVAGRAWDRAKGVAVVDAALERLGNSAPAGVLLGAFDGPAGEHYEPRRIEPLGHLSREDATRWMARATIYVGSSLYEPFGLTPLEAALHECTLVLTDIGSFRELWDGCAEFVPKNDAAALATVVARLDADPERAKQLGRAARARALERYTPDRFAEEYVSVYAALGRRVGGGGRIAAPPLYPTPR